MIGFPTETKTRFIRIHFVGFRASRGKPEQAYTSISIPPYPGTELFDTAVKHGLRIPERVEDWITFNYRNLIQNGPWLSAEMRKIVKMLDFCSYFIGERPLIQPTEETRKVATLLGRLYAPVARIRTRKLWYHFPLEIKLARFFRIYGKQN